MSATLTIACWPVGRASARRANYSADQSDGVNYWTYDVSPTNDYGYHPTFATGNMPYTSPVGYFAANGYGLYDMAGNVMEWCWDWYTDAYYSSSPDSDPRGPASGLMRVLRNGGWGYGGRSQRCAARTYAEPDADCMNNVAGFRCALVLYAPVVSPSLPVITVQPTSLTRPPRGGATFSVEADGSAPLAYQWQLNGLALTGATGSTLALGNVQPADAGVYRVMVTNSYGALTSSPAVLEVSSSAVVELWSPLHGSASPIPLGLGDVVSVAAGTSHTVALRSDGTVRAWGSDTYGQTNVPAGLTNVIAIAAGANHTAALTRDGTVSVWGDGLSGQAVPPNGLSNVTAIAAAANYTLALKADGTVVGWGNNSSGQLDVPAGLSDVVAIAAGTDNGFAIKSDHTVVQWGNGPIWQTWQSNMMETVQLSVAPGRSGIASVAAGAYSGWTLDDDGTAQSWGNLAPEGINAIGVSVAASGSLAQNPNPNDDYGLLLAENGNLYNTTGPSVYNGMYIPSGLSNFVAAAAGYKHAAAVMSDGSPHVARPMLRQTAQAGSTVTLNAGLVGAVPLTYQWRLNGVDLANAANRVLMITNVALATAGEYTCVASNAFGSATNSGGILTVLP